MHDISLVGRRKLFFVFGALTALWGGLFFLFGTVKGDFVSPAFLPSWFHFFLVSSSWIVGISMMVAVGITMYSLKPFFQSPLLHKEKPWFVVCSGLLFGSAFPWGYYAKFGTLFYEKWMWYCGLWCVGTCWSIVVVMYGVCTPHRFLGWFGRCAEAVDSFLACPTLRRIDWIYLTVLSLWVLLATASIHHAVLGGIPHVYDEVAQYFQAKVFAHGRFAMPAPMQPDFFERMYLLIEDDRWFSIYPPGYALLLAVGIWLQCPGWINPLLSSLIVPLLFYFSFRFVSLYVARVSVFLLALSPFFLLMGSSYMNHSSCLFFLVGSVWGIHACIKSKKKGWRPVGSMLSGMAAGFAFLIRPLTTLAFIACLCGWMVYKKIKNRDKVLSVFLLMMLGMIPFLLFYLYYNTQTTGSPFLTGYVHYFDANPMGFGDKPWGEHPLGPRIPRGEFHTPLRGLWNGICNLNGLNSYLFGWPVPSLLFVFLFWVPLFKKHSMDWFCLSVIGFVHIVYVFYFFQDDCFGPRFLFETIPFWILLTARCIEEIRMGKARKSKHHAVLMQTLYCLIGLYFVVAICTSWMERIVQYGDAYWGTDQGVAQLLRTNIEEENAVIFVEDPNDHIAVFSFLDPALKRGWIIAHDLGEERNQQLLHDYREWPVYRLRPKENEVTHNMETVLEPVQR